MKISRKSGLASLGILAAAGCAAPGQPEPLVLIINPHGTTETLTMTPLEHHQKVTSIAAQDAKMLAEDLDLLFMTDRPGRLNRWHTR